MLSCNMFEECSGIEARSCDFADQIFRRHAVADLMDVTSQPCQQMLKLAAVKVARETMCQLICVRKLSSIKAANRIRRKIAKHANGPV